MLGFAGAAEELADPGDQPVNAFVQRRAATLEVTVEKFVRSEEHTSELQSH